MLCSRLFIKIVVILILYMVYLRMSIVLGTEKTEQTWSPRATVGRAALVVVFRCKRTVALRSGTCAVRTRGTSWTCWCGG